MSLLPQEMISVAWVLSSTFVTKTHAPSREVRAQIVGFFASFRLEQLESIVDTNIPKFAKLLGPKGLMPNPKNGTLIADTSKRKKELESGKVAVRGEKKAPLMHTIAGKISLPTEDLSENIETLVKALGMGKVLKATICTSMSPSVRVAV